MPEVVDCETKYRRTTASIGLYKLKLKKLLGNPQCKRLLIELKSIVFQLKAMHCGFKTSPFLTPKPSSPITKPIKRKVISRPPPIESFKRKPNKPNNQTLPFQRKSNKTNEQMLPFQPKSNKTNDQIEPFQPKPKPKSKPSAEPASSTKEAKPKTVKRRKRKSKRKSKSKKPKIYIRIMGQIENFN